MAISCTTSWSNSCSDDAENVGSGGVVVVVVEVVAVEVSADGMLVAEAVAGAVASVAVVGPTVSGVAGAGVDGLGDAAGDSTWSPHDAASRPSTNAMAVRRPVGLMG